MLKEDSKPAKARNLKIIDHLGTLYATFNGSTVWRLEKVAFAILKLCDGKRSVRQIVEEVARKTGLEPRHVRNVVLQILEELQKLGFLQLK